MVTFFVSESIFINTLLSWLSTFFRGGNSWHFHPTKTTFRTGSGIFYPRKICSVSYHRRYFGKLGAAVYAFVS